MVLITYMMYCYAYQDLPVIDAFDTNNHFPTCAKSANNPGGKCVTASEALTLITALKSLVPRLHKEAAGAICQTAEKSEDDEENGVVSFVELGHLLLLRGDTDYVQTVTNMQSLVRLNPHWGISLTKHGMSLEDPPLPMLCYFRTTLWSMLWCLLLGILELGIVAGTGSLLYGFWRRQQQRVQVDALVCRIQDTLKALVELDSTSFLAYNCAVHFEQLLDVVGLESGVKLHFQGHSALEQFSVRSQGHSLSVC